MILDDGPPIFPVTFRKLCDAHIAHRTANWLRFMNKLSISKACIWSELRPLVCACTARTQRTSHTGHQIPVFWGLLKVTDISPPQNSDYYSRTKLDHP